MIASAFRLAVLAVLLASPVLCSAQADAPIAKPDVKPGERWTYQRTDLLKNAPDYVYELVVAYAKGDAILTVHKQHGKEKEADATWTSEWNVVASAQGQVFKTDNPLLRFPLRPGASHSYVSEMVWPREGSWRVRWDMTTKVIGWEEVTVPAGKFRAMKVESSGNFQRLDVRGAEGVARWIVWYVPEVKRWVKITYQGGVSRWGDELIEFKLQ